ncbi:alpha/beta hydrolase [Cohnella thermotolerans]|uniref:alpha/beta hydrolase n=1 Tax=Cohnella thermotolerans TaxID=329858 RepID=UPI000403595C|nr:alpha/beta hydrolase-fold protein [Cohnella thermotolerans]
MRGEWEAFSISGASQRRWIRPDGRMHRIMLWKPEGAPSEAGYPVLYVLDANAVFGTVAEAVRLQTRGPHRLADGAAVVGIGYETNGPFDVERRFYDYTVRAEAEELPPRKDGTPWPATGGADEFLDFLENELKPAIEREVPIDRSRQTLIGHSLGGLLALRALFSGRGTYRFYAAGSPSIWWKNRWIAAEARRWAEQASAPRPLDAGGSTRAVRSSEANGRAREADVRLLLAVGGREKPHMVEDARHLYERLTAEALPGLQVEYCLYPEESHLSVLLPFIAKAVRSALEPPATSE